MERKAFVLLSGGLDSTTCLHQAAADYAPDSRSDWHPDNLMDLPVHWVEAVSIDYGQRHLKETEYARRTCERLGITHTVLSIGDLLSGSSIMLSGKSDVAVPDIAYSDIKGVSPTYVPFRNGLMLSVLTAHAQKYVNAQIKQALYDLDGREIDPQAPGYQGLVDKFTKDANGLVGIYFGAHAEDAHNWAYPDCTPEFIGSMANAIHVGSYFTIRLHTPLEWLNKAAVVALGAKLGVHFEDTWSCYKGEAEQCGVCPTCRSRKEAFQQAGVKDPTRYAS